jgi:hypothetical protein
MDVTAGEALRRQFALVDWGALRSGGSPERMKDDLWTLLTVDGSAANEAFFGLENEVVAQGDLFECAPSVVSAIMAALAGDVVPLANRGAVLDLLCRVLLGHSAPSEVEAGNLDLTQQVHREATKGYWTLIEIAAGERDPYDAWDLAGQAAEMIDEAHTVALLQDPGS